MHRTPAECPRRCRWLASCAFPPCKVEGVGRDWPVCVAVENEDVCTVCGLLGTVRISVQVVLNIEALHVLVEGADVLLRRFDNGHRFISSTIRLARSSPLMSPDQYWCSTASTFSAPSGRVGGSVSAAVRISRTSCGRRYRTPAGVATCAPRRTISSVIASGVRGRDSAARARFSHSPAVASQLYALARAWSRSCAISSRARWVSRALCA